MSEEAKPAEGEKKEEPGATVEELGRRLGDLEAKNTELAQKANGLAIPDEIRNDPAALLKHFNHDPDMVAVEHYSQLIGADQEPTAEAQMKKLEEATAGNARQLQQHGQQANIDKAALEFRLTVGESDAYPVAKAHGTGALQHMWPLMSQAHQQNPNFTPEQLVAKVMPDLEQQLRSLDAAAAQRAQGLAGTVEEFNPYAAKVGEQATETGKPAPAAPAGQVSNSDSAEGAAPAERPWATMPVTSRKRVRMILERIEAKKAASKVS